METKGPNPIHFSEMQRLMDTAYQRRQTLNIKAFRSDGNRVEYRGWIIHHQYWRIFRQMHARLIHDRDGMRYGDALEYLQVDRVYSTELPRMFMSGMTGLYFMVYNDEPIDLSYDAAEWTE